MRKTLALLLFGLVGCYDLPIDSTSEQLQVDPYEALPKYQNGKVLHPYYFNAQPSERFPQKPTAAPATDSRCRFSDAFFRHCMILECSPAFDCPAGSSCWDVALQFNPEGTTPVAEGGPVILADGHGWAVLHAPVCLVGAK